MVLKLYFKFSHFEFQNFQISWNEKRLEAKMYYLISKTL